jgi:NSS family neurotransmitter:Na+ symporter
MSANRGEWSSKLGFILAASGSAIGLGNIWRFPYVVGENGGGAFVLLYLVFVLIIGLPYMLGELALGRKYKKNPVGAINDIKPKSLWKYAGLLGIITGVGILSFYGVIAGWTIGYIYKMAIGQVGDFSAYVSDPILVLLLFLAFMFMTTSIVYGGIEGGIEKWSKILMPVLLILLIALIIYAFTLEGASEGLKFYLQPDFSKITGQTVLSALGQAFFSLSLGMGLMITYGSYLSKKENIISSAGWIVLFDSLIAIMAGLIIFPALFAMGESPAAGPSLVFVVFPKLFLEMPFGLFIGTIFFILLSIASLTSTISLLEVPVAYFVDEKKANRKKIVWWVALFIFIVGIPSALSQGSVEYFTNFGWIPDYLTSPDFLSQASFFFGDFLLAFGALILSIFIAFIWGADNAADEINIGAGKFQGFIRTLWIATVKYFIPVVVFLILLNLFGIFN